MFKISSMILTKFFYNEDTAILSEAFSNVIEPHKELKYKKRAELKSIRIYLVIEAYFNVCYD